MITSATVSTLLWESTDTGESECQWTGGVTISGELFQTGHTLIDKTPTKIIINLRKTTTEGTPSGNAELKLIDSSNVEKATFGTIDVTTITTSFASYTFENSSNTETIVNGDRIAFFYNGDKYVCIEVCASCSESYTNFSYFVPSSWTNRTTVATMEVWGF